MRLGVVRVVVCGGHFVLFIGLDRPLPTTFPSLINCAPRPQNHIVMAQAATRVRERPNAGAAASTRPGRREAAAGGRRRRKHLEHVFAANVSLIDRDIACHGRPHTDVHASKPARRRDELG